MVYGKLFSCRRKSLRYIWTTESKNFVLLWKNIPLLLLETSGTKVNGLHETFFIKTKIFSLYTDNRGQKLLRSHYISSILLESFNCFAWVFRKIFYCPPTIIGNFHSKTSYFVKRKMPLNYIGNLMVGLQGFHDKIKRRQIFFLPTLCFWFFLHLFGNGSFFDVILFSV